MNITKIALGVVLLVAIAIPIVKSRDQEKSVNLEDSSAPALVATKGGTITGHYFQYEIGFEYGDQSQSFKCDALVTANTDHPVVKELRNLVAQENYVNAIDERNRLVVNIELDAISADLKQKILSSSETKPISFNMARKVPVVNEAEPCGSLVVISK